MKKELRNRFIDFASNIVLLGGELKMTYEGRHVFGQLFRSGTSAGANFEESHSAESTRDFIHKREIVLKELRESSYWLELILRAKLVKDEDNISKLLLENEEFIKIVAKSLVTIKSKSK
jgi:four helix bundle protein